MVLAAADSRQNQSIDEHVGLENHYADDVPETGENGECYAIEKLVCHNRINTNKSLNFGVGFKHSRINF